MRANLTSGSRLRRELSRTVAGDGNQDRVQVLRHSHRKRRVTGLPHLSPRRHPLTLPPDPLPLYFSKVMRQPKHLWLGVVLLARCRVMRDVGRVLVYYG
jgi:hypothetical protein